MSNLLAQLPRRSRVAVIRLRSLGDCVLTTPSVALLKRARPDLRVAMVVEDRFAAVFEGNPDIEAILPPEVGRVAAWSPRLCLNLHGGPTSMLLTAGCALSARFRAGFAHYRGRFLYNLAIPRAQEILGEDRKVHTAEHLASAMFYLGVPQAEIPGARLFAGAPPDRRAYAVLHPVASSPDKTWPAWKFLQVAEFLQREMGLEPVFIGGKGDDLSTFSAHSVVCGAPLARVKALMSGASLFVGNDSGPAHIAAAFRIPVAVLFGPSDPVVWAPWRTPARVLVSPEGIERIRVEDVTEALGRLRVAA